MPTIRQSAPNYGCFIKYCANIAVHNRVTKRYHPDGTTTVLYDGKEIPHKEFNEMYPVGLIDKSKHGERLDSRQRIFLN